MKGDRWRGGALLSEFVEHEDSLPCLHVHVGLLTLCIEALIPFEVHINDCNLPMFGDEWKD